jgi:hypothetical protein
MSNKIQNNIYYFLAIVVILITIGFAYYVRNAVSNHIPNSYIEKERREYIKYQRDSLELEILKKQIKNN